MRSNYSSATSAAPPSDDAEEGSAWTGVGVLIALTAAMAGYVIWVLQGL